MTPEGQDAERTNKVVADPMTRVVVEARRATVTLTAEDWQLYVSTMDCDEVAKELNVALEEAVSSGTDRDGAYRAVAAVMDDRSEYGAYDSEPRAVLAQALDVAYGPRPQPATTTASDEARGFLRGRPDPAAAAADGLREFFRSDAALAFLDEHCAGERPWALVLDGERRLVLASPDRDAFYVVAPTPSGFDVSLADDPLAVIDPESESSEPLGSFADASSAFDAAARHAGLSDGPAPR